MRSLIQLPIFLTLLVLIGTHSRASAETVGSGQLFTSLIETSAGIMGADPDGLWRSTDDGAIFTSVYSEPDELYFALASAGNIVIAVGEDGLVARSDDGGNTWSQATSPSLFGDLVSVATDGNGVWLATGDNFGAHLLRSSDDGLTWTELTAPSGSGLRAIAWQANTDWILAGEGDNFDTGIIYRSTDDGDSWQLLAEDLAAPIHALAINADGDVLAVGEGGLILSGTLSTAFSAPSGYTRVSEDLYAAIVTSSGSFLIGGESGTLLTFDGSVVEDISLGGDPDVTALLLLPDDNLLISGIYEAPVPQERTIPFALLISRDAVSGDFILTVAETLTDRSYRIESSIDLLDWPEVVGSERTGNGGAQIWTFPEAGPRLFWRAVEF